MTITLNISIVLENRSTRKMHFRLALGNVSVSANERAFEYDIIIIIIIIITKIFWDVTLCH